MVARGVELFAFDPGLAAGVAAELVEDQPAQQAKVLGGLAAPRPILIFVHLHIQDPVQLVLHAPVFAHRPGEGRHVQRQA